VKSSGGTPCLKPFSLTYKSHSILIVHYKQATPSIYVNDVNIIQ